MNEPLKKTLGWICVLLVLAFVTLAFPQQAAADDDDPPSRVARLNYLRGSVSFQPAGETDWVSAVVNRPMTTGDRLWTDNDARAEMHIGSAAIRLDTNTGFSFLNLDDRTVQIQLSEGTLNLRVKRVDPDEILEVDAPNLAFSILQPGQYRIQASEDGNSTMVTVRSGQGEATGGGRTYTVNSGLSGAFTGTDSLQADIYRSADNDEFDNWSQDRDRRDDGSRSARYVSHDVVGYEDLDDNGTWRSDRNYGDIWVPRVAAGWAPYRDGHWAWISPWGWTWVDDEPWGYAPFHYGRWVNVEGNWGWVPGPVAVRPVYAPALVAFIGGPRFGLAISVGGGGGDVGWFPLGPREVYVPGYNTSRAYVDRVNVSNTTVNSTTITNVYNTQVTNINNNTTNRTEITYANRTVPGGVTAVPQSAFTSAQPVARAAVKMDAQQIVSAPVNSRAAFVPTKSSVLGTSAPTGARIAQPPAAVASRTVVAKTPPPPPPVPFEKQQQSLAAHPGQPLARTEVQNLRPANAPAAQPLVRQAPPGKPAVANTYQPGSQPPNVRPSNVPPPNPAANAPVNNAPPVRNDRPQDRPNQSQPGNVRPSNVPPPNPAANAPVNNAPPVRNDRPQDRPNQSQPGNVRPSNVPPPNPAANAPVNNAPPVRNDRPQDRPNQSQPGNVRPSNVPPPNPAANAPVNNAPPVRNDRPQDRPNQSKPGNERPSNVPPPNPAANAPVNNAPPVRSDRPQDRPNQSQPGNQQPARSSETARPANPQSAQPPQETPQEKKDRLAREKKNQGDKSQQH